MIGGYSFDDLKQAIRNPRLICREINSYAHRGVPKWNYRKKGLDFLSEDWDNLLILDACRYDLFAEYNTILGELERKYSKSSSTVGFLRTNVDCVDLSDTVYVTANGQIHNHKDEINANFFDVIPLYAEEWDNELGTVPAKAVTRRALQAEKEYPDKRLLVHYVQPHYPFIDGDLDIEIGRTGDDGIDKAFWRRIFDGDVSVSPDELWTAYRKTFQGMLEHVETAVDGLTGKTVVTSDHGNMFGERGYPIPIREWGHPDKLYYPHLVEVPWLVCKDNKRKSITTGETKKMSLEPDPAVVKQRLSDLGYRE